MNKIKNLIINISIPLVLGVISALISNISNNINSINLPSFTPPSIVFIIVWTTLYILMGISSYLIVNSDSINKYDALKTYGINLIINILWSILFFKYKLFFLAIISIIILIILTVIMIYKYFNINRISSYIQIPYLIWLLLALLLSINVYLIN